MTPLQIALAVYAGGVLLGLALTNARWPVRLGLALAWPLGPLAFVLTVALLLAVAAVVFPIFGGIVALIVLLFLLM